jgi:hypothetical protein
MGNFSRVKNSKLFQKFMEKEVKAKEPKEQSSPSPPPKQKEVVEMIEATPV